MSMWPKSTTRLKIGDIVRPTVDNGFWYVATNAPNTVSSSVTSGQVLTNVYNKLLAIKKANGVR